MSRRDLERAEREEDTKERLEREHGELINELRALIPGAEVLFGFLLAIRFTSEYERLSSLQEILHLTALFCVAVALVLFLAPAAHHRIQFRQGDKAHLLPKANREAIMGTVAMGLGLSGSVALVLDLVFGTALAALLSAAFLLLVAWRWWAGALFRRLAPEPAVAPEASRRGRGREDA